MGSKGRAPAHLRRPVSGPGLLHLDPFGPGIHPPPSAFPFDMLPPREVAEQKIAAQHVEAQKLATENQRLAASHSTLRQDLAAAYHEKQRVLARSDAVAIEQEQQIRVILDKIAKMEADLKASEPIKLQLQQAHAEAQSLIAARQELISKVQQLNQDLQRSHGDVQQIPALMSELEALRREYEHCRATYDYERKLRIDHYESLQVMENNYVSMVREVEMLRTELTNAANIDSGANNTLGGQFGASAVHKESDKSSHLSPHKDGYGAQGQVPSLGTSHIGGGASVPASSQPGYDASRGSTYDVSRASYDTSRVVGHDSSHGGSYEGHRGTGYEVPRGSGYDSARGAGWAPTVALATAAAATGKSAVAYESARSAQALSSYGGAPAELAYGSAPQPGLYGSSQQPAYGSAQQLTYGSAKQLTYGSVQQSTYGSAPQPA